VLKKWWAVVDLGCSADSYQDKTQVNHAVSCRPSMSVQSMCFARSPNYGRIGASSVPSPSTIVGLMV
jgi:hypothetical protein